RASDRLYPVHDSRPRASGLRAARLLALHSSRAPAPARARWLQGDRGELVGQSRVHRRQHESLVHVSTLDADAQRSRPPGPGLGLRIGLIVTTPLDPEARRHALALQHPDPQQLWFQITEIFGERTYLQHGVRVAED